MRARNKAAPMASFSPSHSSMHLRIHDSLSLWDGGRGVDCSRDVRMRLRQCPASASAGHARILLALLTGALESAATRQPRRSVGSSDRSLRSQPALVGRLEAPCNVWIDDRGHLPEAPQGEAWYWSRGQRQSRGLGRLAHEPDPQGSQVCGAEMEPHLTLFFSPSGLGQRTRMGDRSGAHPTTAKMYLQRPPVMSLQTLLPDQTAHHRFP